MLIDKDMKKIEELVLNCKKCNLYKTRKKAVFGNGSIDANIFFIGEAPGRSEDIYGFPFVGRAGKFLDELLKSIGLTREAIFISNILKCRPPKNRNPQKSEIEKCKKYLDDQIKIIKPNIIVTLGNFATFFIFEKYGIEFDKISNIHGKVFEKNNLIIIPQFHPAVAIYNSNKKDILFNDFKIIKKLLKK